MVIEGKHEALQGEVLGGMELICTFKSPLCWSEYGRKQPFSQWLALFFSL